MKKVKHGLTHHRLYPIWGAMMQRCNNIKNKNYIYYGERGIKVCDEWHNVENFIKDMYPTFQEGLELDRIDNNLGYYKENCRWVNRSTQLFNRRIPKNNKSGYRGVYLVNKTKHWVSVIKIDNKMKQIGTYKTAIEAAKAYDRFVIKNNLKNILNFDIDTNSNIKNILIKQYRKKVALRKNLIYNDLIRKRRYMKDKIQKLISKYSKDIELLKQGNYAESTKVQTVCVLREVIEDLKRIVK